MIFAPARPPACAANSDPAVLREQAEAVKRGEPIKDLADQQQRVKEVRPYEDRLRALIELTFAKPLPAEELGTLLKAGVVAIVPAELRDAVLAQFRESLAGGTAPAASPRHADFNRRIARQL